MPIIHQVFGEGKPNDEIRQSYWIEMFGVESICRRGLGIVGSPCRGGNTKILVDTVLRGSEKVDAQVEKVILSELHIALCQACNGCRKTDECVQRDDMAALSEKMQRSQVWVLGMPVYYFGPTDAADRENPKSA